MHGGSKRSALTFLMPTVLRSGAYRFFFYSADREEPAHVHVARGSDEPSSGWNRFASRGARVSLALS